MARCLIASSTLLNTNSLSTLQCNARRNGTAQLPPTFLFGIFLTLHLGDTQQCNCTRLVLFVYTLATMMLTLTAK